MMQQARATEKTGSASSVSEAVDMKYPIDSIKIDIRSMIAALEDGFQPIDLVPILEAAIDIAKKMDIFNKLDVEIKKQSLLVRLLRA